MLRQGNKKVILILMPVLLVACARTAQTASPGILITDGTGATQAASTSVPQAGQSFSMGVSTGGTTRDAWVHIPAGYSSAKAAPLIVNFRGLGSNGQEQETQTGMSALADLQGFLVAYPNGVNKNGKQQWDSNPGSTDLQFISHLIQKLQTDYKADLYDGHVERRRHDQPRGLRHGGCLCGHCAG